jgi:hypothetical protein
MTKHLHVLPECYADTLLVNRLIQSTTNHKHSISKVFKALKETFSNSRAIGIIDDDKKKDYYFNSFKVLKDGPFFRYLAHPNGKHFIIAIKGGGIEKLILQGAKEVNFDHPLLADFEKFKLKSKSINEDIEIRSIINALIKSKAPTLMDIKKILFQHI